MRKELFDFDWLFHKGDIEFDKPFSKGASYLFSKSGAAKGAAKVEYDTINWTIVSLPHDYTIEEVPSPDENASYGYLKNYNAWYRKNFKLSKDFESKRISLYFEGIAINSVIYVNGHMLHRNYCSFTSFEVDITDVAFFGEKENLVAVYTNTDSCEGWWYQGGGIYRHVWLYISELISTDLWGVYVNPKKLGEEKWNVPIETTIRNDSLSSKTITVKSSIIASDGKELLSLTDNIFVPAKDKAKLLQSGIISSPLLWDIISPNLYNLKTEIYSENKLLDENNLRFGFRTINLDPNEGFFINGRHEKLKGVNCHQDFGLSGIATPDRVFRYRMELLKEMGINAYRTAHNPTNEAELDVCDELGILVLTETRHFDSSPQALSELEMLLKRDRSRACIFIWSLGNEETIQKEMRSKKIMQTMTAFVKKYDARPCMAAIDDRSFPEDMLASACEVIGINYSMDKYDYLHEKFPYSPIIASEVCACPASRAHYFDDDNISGFYSSYDHIGGESNPNYQTFSSTRKEAWKMVDSRKFVAGMFIWAGIEHRGETDWPRLCSQSGCLDLYLQKKDAFYQNKAQFTSEPMIHIVPSSWNFEGCEGRNIRVVTYTNTDNAELFLNGKSLGKIFCENYEIPEWSVPYEKGELLAIGYKNGIETAREIIKTTGRAKNLVLRLESENLKADGQDCAILTCYCTDENGSFVPDASPKVTFSVNSFGTLIGTGSDITDHIPPKSPSRKMRMGLISLAVRCGKVKGNLTVSAVAENMSRSVIDIPLT